MIQTALFEVDTGPAALEDTDWIIVNHSGGKDSGALLVTVVRAARAAGVLHRVVVLHNPMGLYEWPGADEIAASHAAHYGLRYEERAADGDLLDQVRRRRMWMDALARYCTSWAKRSPGRRFVTELVNELGPLGRTAQVRYALGMRAQESSGRAKLEPLAVDASHSSGVRTITLWHPILHLTEAEVWDLHRTEGLPHHTAYDQAMSRLSCSLCVLASREDLVRACQLRPDLAQKYAAVEWEIGDSFKPKLSMIELIAEARNVRPDRDRVQVLRLRTAHNRGARKLTRLAAKTSTVAEYERKASAMRHDLLTLQSRMRAAGYDGALDDWSLTA
ncbi:phosphoadenosine phosphosulfate reductase domain-containing protein [Nocardiopsis terrae]|uniref:phosphoadenosine phosphosulfate reductase domain-containing protein n=1 Tax=Streptomyces sp. NPDC057554 TaxID=3350538 RepID=UPI003682BDBD